MLLSPIGHIESPYLTKFGVPRQPGLASAAESRIHFEPTYSLSREARWLDCVDWIVVLWSFSHNLDSRSDSVTVRPPLLGGTKRVGVFASRSSFRPNGLALSCVHVNAINHNSITVSGADMVDGTPVFDIKPYKRTLHCHEDADSGWQGQTEWPSMEHVDISDEYLMLVPMKERLGLLQVLRLDPRPAYTRTGQEDREFWTVYGSVVVWFTVRDRVLHVTRLRIMNDEEREHVKRTGSIPI